MDDDPSSLAITTERVTESFVKDDKSILEISSVVGVNPCSVVSIRRDKGLVNASEYQHEIENLLSHRVWQLGKLDPDGIIPFDEGLGEPTLLERVRHEIETLFCVDRAVAVEIEIDEVLGRGGLAGWLGDPFFRKHKGQFKGRPILWQIVSPQKRFRVLVYYHKLDHDTLPKVRSKYLWPLLERARTRLRAARSEDKPDLKTIGDLESTIADLEECDRRLESVIQGTVEVDLPDWAVGPYRNGKAPYNPDINDGVKVNILPLQAAGLLPMKKVV